MTNSPVPTTSSTAAGGEYDVSRTFLGVPLGSERALPNSSPLLCPFWVSEWLDQVEESEGLTAYVPFMASTDVRQDRERVCVVDPNRYPQGFNNVLAEDFARGVGVLVGAETGPVGSWKTRLRATELRENIRHLHVVEEDYASRLGGGQNHPYYRHVAKLYDFVRELGAKMGEVRGQGGAVKEVRVTGSTRIAVDGGNGDGKDAESHLKRELATICDLTAPYKDSSGNPLSPSPVLNIYNTSYPSDLENSVTVQAAGDTEETRKTVIDCDIHLPGGAGKEEESVLRGFLPEQVGFSHEDPRLYNSYLKNELFSEVHCWLVQFLARQREQIFLDEDDEAETASFASECPSEGFQVVDIDAVEPSPKVSPVPLVSVADDPSLAITSPPEVFSHSTLDLEARFDCFPGSIGSQQSLSRKTLCRLVGGKLTGSRSESPWFKTFVKDDAGCNGVGLLAFSKRDLVPGKPFLNLTHAHRMDLRGRNKGGRRCYVLQEGIVTSLLRKDPSTQHTTHQLEVVLMFIDGRIFNYFIRQTELSLKQSDSTGVDCCVSLNVADVSFVQRRQFETDPSYREAFLQVRREWWKYEVSGRLSVLAMAKQAKRYKEGSVLAGPARAAKPRAREPAKPKASAPPGTPKSAFSAPAAGKVSSGSASASSNLVAAAESSDAFSRRLSGLLSKSVNQNRTLYSNDTMKAIKPLIKDVQKVLQGSGGGIRIRSFGSLRGC